MSKFIVFEGLDNCGKTTQVSLLNKKIPDSITLRELGATPIGESIRTLVLSHEMSQLSQMLLFMAARRELHSTVINPALREGKTVILDRWGWSTIAYQQDVKELDILRTLKLASHSIYPDITFYLDISIDEMEKRSIGKKKDVIESKGRGYFEKVRSKYLELVKYDPSWRLLDGSRSIEDIHATILEYL